MMWSMPALPITVTQVTKNNETFVCEMIDLKRNGFFHYTKALNNLTYGFFAPWLKTSDKYIEDLAEFMKSSTRTKTE